jgi:PilZ domain
VTADVPTVPVPELRCKVCGLRRACTSADLRMFRVVGAPKCCARQMALPVADPLAVGRSRERRAPRDGTRAVVRRGGAELGPDVGAGLADLSVDGACVRVRASVEPGDELVVGLVGADGRAVVRAKARVRWSRPLGDGLFAAGLEFNRPLSRTELASLV